MSTVVLNSFVIYSRLFIESQTEAILVYFSSPLFAAASFTVSPVCWYGLYLNLFTGILVLKVVQKGQSRLQHTELIVLSVSISLLSVIALFIHKSGKVEVTLSNRK